MQALFSTMQETEQQPMTDFRRLCLEAEEKNELDAAPDDMDDGQQPGDPYADEIKRLEAEYGPLIEGQHLTVQLQDQGQGGELLPITAWSRNWPIEV